LSVNFKYFDVGNGSSGIIPHAEVYTIAAAIAVAASCKRKQHYQKNGDGTRHFYYVFHKKLLIPMALPPRESLSFVLVREVGGKILL